MGKICNRMNLLKSSEPIIIKFLGLYFLDECTRLMLSYDAETLVISGRYSQKFFFFINFVKLL